MKPTKFRAGRVSVRIPVEIERALASSAARRGIYVSDVVNEALREWSDRNRRKAA